MANMTIIAKDKQYLGNDTLQVRGSGFFGFVKGVVACRRIDDNGTMEIEYDGCESSLEEIKKCLEENNFEIA